MSSPSSASDRTPSPHPHYQTYTYIHTHTCTCIHYVVIHHSSRSEYRCCTYYIHTHTDTYIIRCSSAYKCMHACIHTYIHTYDQGNVGGKNIHTKTKRYLAVGSVTPGRFTMEARRCSDFSQLSRLNCSMLRFSSNTCKQLRNFTRIY